MKIRIDQDPTIHCSEVELRIAGDSKNDPPHLLTTFKCGACDEDHTVRLFFDIREVLFMRDWCDRIHVKGSLS